MESLNTTVEPLDIEKYQMKKCTWTLDGANKDKDPHIHTKP